MELFIIILGYLQCCGCEYGSGSNLTGSGDPDRIYFKVQNMDPDSGTPRRHQNKKKIRKKRR
jgi:hypothetical protein